jgi:hypothetical protein
MLQGILTMIDALNHGRQSSRQIETKTLRARTIATLQKKKTTITTEQ